jgi:hypothetical protein
MRDALHRPLNSPSARLLVGACRLLGRHRGHAQVIGALAQDFAAHDRLRLQCGLALHLGASADAASAVRR